MQAILHADRGTGFPLLYIPGIDGTGELLLGTGVRLEDEFRLIRFCYRADDDAASDSYADLAASIATLCGQQGVAECMVIAESFGGAVALQLALDFPKLVRGLAIVNSFARFPSPVRLRLSRALSIFVSRTMFDLGRRHLAPRSLFGRRAHSEVVEAFRNLPGAFFDESYKRRMDMIAELDLRPRLAELHQPLMLFSGDADRIVPSLETMPEIAQHVPHATHEVVSGGGHLILPLPEEPWPERFRELQSRISNST
jgi:3-oxoadipate enol-lactonase